MSERHHVTDGEHNVTADELVNGRLYVLVDAEDGSRHLRHLPRNDDDLPRIRIMEEALEAIRTLCRGMRKEMGGYRPDYTLVLSALVLDACSRPEAPSTVRDFAIATFQAAQAEGAQTDSGTEDVQTDESLTIEQPATVTQPTGIAGHPVTPTEGTL
jgi:hypothetical protein